MTSVLEATKPDDELNQSLLHDLSGEISLALSTREIYMKWGRHYLLSMHNAHFRQLCNSFKDPGPLQYGKHSPLFIACRDRMEQAFASLPPPIPSIALIDKRGNLKKGTVSMNSYHDRDGSCFAVGCGVKLLNGTTVEVETLKAGVTVWTPKGARKVAAIVETTIANKKMCRLGNLVITPWHPICFDGRWTFPNAVTSSTFLYSGTIYSLMLEPDKDVGAHGVEVGGQLAVTLGHGITRANIAEDNRSHPFFGDYMEVQRSLTRLKIRDGVLISMGMEKDGVNGLACGFLGEDSEKQTSTATCSGHYISNQLGVFVLDNAGSNDTAIRHIISELQLSSLEEFCAVGFITGLGVQYLLFTQISEAETPSSVAYSRSPIPFYNFIIGSLMGFAALLARQLWSRELTYCRLLGLRSWARRLAVYGILRSYGELALPAVSQEMACGTFLLYFR